MTFSDEDSASAWLSKVRQLIELDSWTPPEIKPVKTIPTVGGMVEQWLESCEKLATTGELRLTSLQTYENILSKRVLNDAELCSIPIDELTPRDVSHWWERVSTSYPDTVNRNKRAYSKLKAAVAVAVEYGYIDNNPVQIKAARKRALVKKKNLATTKQLSSILDEMPDRYKLVTCLCLFHGLRIGEALAVKRRCFETTSDGGLTVRIEGTLQRITITQPAESGRSSQGHVTMRWQPPKTQAGYRVVPILSDYRWLVQQHLDKYPGAPDGYATTTDKNTVVLDTSFRSIFNRARDRAGAPSEITPHYGRNWLITRLAEAGATPKEIGAVLGQEDVSTIVNVYMRVRQHRPAELMKLIKPED